MEKAELYRKIIAEESETVLRENKERIVKRAHKRLRKEHPEIFAKDEEKSNV